MSKSLEVKGNYKTIPELLKESQGGFVKLDNVEESINVLSESLKKYEKLKVTPSNIKESKAIRTEIRQKRYDLQNLEKNNVAALNNLRTEFKNDIAKMIGIITPVEERFTNSIKELEDEKKRIKAEKELKEQNRIDAIKLKISNATKQITDSLMSVKFKEDIKSVTDTIEEFKKEFDSLEEYKFLGETLVAEMETKVEELDQRISDQMEKEKEIKALKEKEIANKEAQEKKDAQARKEKAEADAKIKELQDKIDAQEQKEKAQKEAQIYKKERTALLKTLKSLKVDVKDIKEDESLINIQKLIDDKLEEQKTLEHKAEHDRVLECVKGGWDRIKEMTIQDILITNESEEIEEIRYLIQSVKGMLIDVDSNLKEYVQIPKNN